MLPGALIAGFLATFPLHWLLYLGFAESGTFFGFIELPTGANIFVEYALYPFVIAIVYILVGFEIAPKYKFRTALTLAGIYLTVIIGTSVLGARSGIAASFGIRSFGPIIGLLIGLYIVWKKQNKVS